MLELEQPEAGRILRPPDRAEGLTRNQTVDFPPGNVALLKPKTKNSHESASRIQTKKPGTVHAGGVWKRQIRRVRNVLSATLIRQAG